MIIAVFFIIIISKKKISVNNLITKGEHGVPYTPDKAVKVIISLAKKDFDSDVVKAFQKAIGFYPNNTRVKLSNGSIARVIEQNPNLPLIYPDLWL